MGFRLTGLPLEDFAPLFRCSDEQLRQRNAMRLPAEEGFPCRISLRDADPGEPVLLLSYEHQGVATPYRSSGPIFVRQAASGQAMIDNEVPQEMRGRLYSARGYDAAGMMVDADVAEGAEIEPLIERLFGDTRINYIHLHHARRGCYACRVDRL